MRGGLLVVEVLAVDDPVARGHGGKLAPHRHQHQHLRLSLEARQQPRHHGPCLVLAQVVEHVPSEHRVEALVGCERQQTLDERRHRLRTPALERLGGERAVEVGDADATGQRRQELEVARERGPEVEHGRPPLPVQALEQRPQRQRAMRADGGRHDRGAGGHEPAHGRLRDARAALASASRAAALGTLADSASARSASGLRGRDRRGSPLLGRRLHLDAAPEAAAVLEPDPGRREVAEHGRRLADHDLLARDQVAVHLAGDAHELGLDVGLDAAALADRHAVLGKHDLALDLAEDREVLVAGHVAHDPDRRADPGGLVAVARGRRRSGLRRHGG